jgi:thiamine pyrophosphate-dependent acetolactate synthase large subunit-like protein
VKLAEAYGHVGMTIEKPADVEPRPARSLRQYKDRLVFLDFITDQPRTCSHDSGGQGPVRDDPGL